MELVFEMLNADQPVTPQLRHKHFGPAGGMIGRGEGCDWSIPDRKRLLSKHHATVSFREGRFYLTDTSGNGVTYRDSGARMTKDEPIRINDGDVYVLGEFEIRARLVYGPVGSVSDASHTGARLIPDDAFLDLDPLKALDRQAHAFTEIDELINPTAMPPHALERTRYACVDMDHLLVPELVEAPVESVPASLQAADENPSEDFWARFGAALGMALDDLDQEAREALAISSALLLKQSVEGLQQSLRTRSELKNELRLSHTLLQGEQTNPLKCANDAPHALRLLLRPDTSAGLSADRTIARAFRDLQAHQVALLTASRASLRATLEHFSPRQLVLRLERDHKPLINTSGRYWKAYGRYHRALCESDDWTERLLARDFAKAYEEQVRLIRTLHADHHG